MVVFLLFLLSLFPFEAPPGIELRVELSSSAPARGSICLALFDSPETFAADQKRAERIIPADADLAAVFSGLPPGDYVLAAFHDLDGDKKLDRNFFGVPTEPYGFSREPKSKWKAPDWSDVATRIDKSNALLKVRLSTWKERE